MTEKTKNVMDKKDQKIGALYYLKAYGWLIAYVSLFATIINAWYSHLVPFSPNPSFGGICLISEVYDSKLKNFTLGLPVTFYNSGSSAGMINDISIKMEGTGDNDLVVMFFPAMYYDSKDLAKAKIDNLPELNAIESFFSGIYLPPKQYVHKEIMFYMDEKKRGLAFSPGLYRFSIYLQEMNSSFKLYETRDEKISHDTINKLGKTKMTILLHYPERDKFIEQNIAPDKVLK